MPEPKRPLKVFLCHASADKAAVRDLYNRLTKDGVDAWLDKEKLLPGQDWELEIRKAVREADVVVVCLSKQFTQAGYRQKEVRLVLEISEFQPLDNIFIIPVRLQDCEVPVALSRWHWVDYYEEGSYNKLINSLAIRANQLKINIPSLPKGQDAKQNERSARSERKSFLAQTGSLTSKVSAQKITNARVRNSLITLGDGLLASSDRDMKFLVNIFGVSGIGKTLFLEKVLIPKFKNGKNPYTLLKMPNVSEDQNAAALSATSLLNWLNVNIFRSGKNFPKENEIYDLKDLENMYSELSAKKLSDYALWSNKRFAILVDDVDNLSIDELDWFQSVVLETISSIPGSIICLTSHNELNWHSWELRTRCMSRELDDFSIKEIQEICPSKNLATKLLELSAGHPGTLVSLLHEVKKEYKGKISEVRAADLDDTLGNMLIEKLKLEIEKSLFARVSFEWLKEIFYLCSAVEYFDADLVGDVVTKLQIAIPDDVTDIAWEMTYTGLANWDFEKKAYKLVPDLRKRIVAYMIAARSKEYSRVFDVIAKSYLTRAKVFPEKEIQLVYFMHYQSMARIIDGRTWRISVEIMKSLEPWMKTVEQRNRLIKAFTENNEKVDFPAPLHKLLELM